MGLVSSRSHLSDEVEFIMNTHVVTATRDVICRFLGASLCTGYKPFNQRRYSPLFTKPGKNLVLSMLCALLILGGDIELNPGPTQTSQSNHLSQNTGVQFPCGHCGEGVTWTHTNAVVCNKCEKWYHGACIEKCTQGSLHSVNSNTAWLCEQCNFPNHLASYYSFEFEMSNYYNPLSMSDSDPNATLPSVCSVFSPVLHSSPTKPCRMLKPKFRSKMSSIAEQSQVSPGINIGTEIPSGRALNQPHSIPQDGPQQVMKSLDSTIPYSQTCESRDLDSTVPYSDSAETRDLDSTKPYTYSADSMELDSTRPYSEHDSTSDQLPNKGNNWRTLVVNCNSIRGKVPDVAHLIDYTKPDSIIFTETKIDSSVNTSELLPPNYKAFRKDRKMGGGGVMIAIKSHYSAEEIPVDASCETVWVKIPLQQNTLYTGAFYRQPNNKTEQVEELDKAMKQLAPSFGKNSTVILGGDFNVGDVNWDDHVIPSESKQKAVSSLVMDVLGEHHLTQQQLSPSRENRVLDLFCTNKPTLTKHVSVIPGISDHGIVVADSDIKPQHNKKPPRKIHLFSKADWSKLKEDTLKFQQSYLETEGNKDVEECWQDIKSYLNSMLESSIPSKMTSTRYNLPWFNRYLHRLCKRKQRLFNKAKKTGKKCHWESFKRHQKFTIKAIRNTHWEYLNNILAEGLAEGNTRPFWRYIKSRKQDSFGIAPLKEDGVVHSEAREKAEILNRQFESVFTQEDGEAIPQM